MIESLSITEYDAFPTKMYELQFDEDLIDMSRIELNRFKEVGLPSGVHNYYTSYNNPNNLNVGSVTNKILDSISCTISRQLEKQYAMDNSWVNYVPKGCIHAMHRHGDDRTISGIIYYDDIGETHFFDPRIQIYNEVPEKVSAKKGKVIIFPGWLMHEMPPHFEEIERVTIAFNLWRVWK